MRLPDDLDAALNNEFGNMSLSALTAAAEELSARYRSVERDLCKTFMTENAHRMAYLAVRLPATYAAVARVLNEVKSRLPEFTPHTLCDVGAGPGTATWAAAEVFPEIRQASLYEKDAGWLTIGRRLMQQAQQPLLQSAGWHQSDLLLGADGVPQDLLILSYVIGELPLKSIQALVSTLWQRTSQVLVVIEPGTPHGFERIRLVREQLIESGAFLVAPCPHAGVCPMLHGDWCHFSQRLERSSLHMAVKSVLVGFEDEKFSYVVASKKTALLPEARIVRHPQHHSGHVELQLCAREGLEKRVISRRHGSLYKLARKLEWGDALPEKD